MTTAAAPEMTAERRAIVAAIAAMSTEDGLDADDVHNLAKLATDSLNRFRGELAEHFGGASYDFTRVVPDDLRFRLSEILDLVTEIEDMARAAA